MLAWKTDPARAPAQPCARTRSGAEQRGARSRVRRAKSSYKAERWCAVRADDTRLARRAAAPPCRRQLRARAAVRGEGRGVSD